MYRKISARVAGLLLLSLLLPGGTTFSAEKPVVYFGVNLRFQPITMYDHYQPMLDYLTRNTSYKFELKISQDYEETTKFLMEGKIDVASIGDGGQLRAMLLPGVVPIVSPLNEEGKPSYRSCFIVPAKTTIRSLQDLKGKNIALGYHHSTSGNLVPRSMLLKQGIRISDLGSMTNMRHHRDVATSVLKGKYDAGFVKESVANSMKKDGLQILSCSDELLSIPLLARPGLSAQVIKELTSALVKLDHRNPQDRKMMENWDIEYQYGFVPAATIDYAPLTTMYKRIPYGCGSGCHK
ncbi:MAG: phosphonate ABC transporter substrate-binding protein [Deltaproteobacteria bacterium HGW-Deltaproteobacteria-4]|nr:MAG: phosphonate ABC transporter substrate-binding protein [Deltaproteobacteria bacterium HGW-Deltaproteobacteria-4]